MTKNTRDNPSINTAFKHARTHYLKNHSTWTIVNLFSTGINCWRYYNNWCILRPTRDSREHFSAATKLRPFSRIPPSLNSPKPWPPSMRAAETVAATLTTHQRRWWLGGRVGEILGRNFGAQSFGCAKE